MHPLFLVTLSFDSDSVVSQHAGLMHTERLWVVDAVTHKPVLDLPVVKDEN